MASRRKPMLAALAALALRCAPSRPAVVAPTAAPATQPAEQESPPPVLEGAGEYDPLEHLRALTPAGAEPQLIAGDRRRYVLEQDRLRALPDSAGRIVSTAHIGAHWLFADSDGLVVRSEGVDGPLERVAELPTRLENILASDTRGRGAAGSVLVQSLAAGASEGVLPLVPSPGTRELVLVGEDGSVRRSEFAHAPVSAVFASASLGAVLLESGQVLCTADGGERWAPFERGFGRGTGLARRGALVEVRGSLHSATIGDGCRAPRGSSVRLEGAQTVSTRAHARALAERDPSDVGELWASQSLRVETRGGALWRVDARTGEILRVAGDALPSGAGPEECRAVPFASDMLVVCALEGEAEPVWAALLEGRERPARVLFSASGELSGARGSSRSWSAVVDPAGRFFITAGACSPAEPRTVDSFCRVARDGSRSPLRLANPSAAPVGILGDVLLRRTLAGFVAHDARTGAAVALDAGLWNTSLRVAIAPTGVLYGVAGEGDARTLVLGTDLARIARRALPAGAVGAGFVDARRGVAYGLDSTQLWHTRDGGERWEPLDAYPSPRPGQRVPLALVPSVPVPAVGACAVDRCKLGGWLVARWGEPRRSSFLGRSERAPDLPRVSYDARHEPAYQPFVDAPLDCAAARPAATNSAGNEPYPGDYSLLPQLALRCDPDTLRCRWSDRAHGGGGEEFGLRTERLFSLAPPGWAAPVGEARLRERFDDPTAWRVLATAPNGVVLETSVGNHERRVYVGPDLRPRWLEEPSAERSASAGIDSIYERWAFADPWLLRPEGIFSMRMARAGDRERVRVVLRHGLDGRLASFSPALVTADPNPWPSRLAVHHGVVGVLSFSRVPGDVLFWPPDGSEPTRERAPWGESVGFCEEGAARPSEWLVVHERSLHSSDVRPDWWPSELSAEIEAGPGGACARRLWSAPWRAPGGTSVPSLVVRRRSGAILVESRRGFFDPIEQRRCELR